jgi:uncharacterized protein YjhX (UPF0386 family)
VKSRRYVLAFALMIALTAQAKAQVVLDDHTPCSAAVEAFDQEGSILISVAVGFCRQRQKETIRDEAGRAYRVGRGLYGLSSAPEK